MHKCLVIAWHVISMMAAARPQWPAKEIGSGLLPGIIPSELFVDPSSLQMCVVCNDFPLHPVSICATGCRTTLYCVTCAPKVLNQHGTCPTCRRDVIAMRGVEHPDSVHSAPVKCIHDGCDARGCDVNADGVAAELCQSVNGRWLGGGD